LCTYPADLNPKFSASKYGKQIITIYKNKFTNIDKYVDVFLDLKKIYRTYCQGFENAKITTKQLLKDIDVEPVFAQKSHEKS